jgi:acyl-CoA-binding protein
MSLERKFERAAKKVWRLKAKPDDDTLLELYALYKQATEGDVEGRRPLRGGMKAMVKWRAWKGLRGMPIDDAMSGYCDMVSTLFTSRAAA